MASLPFSSIQAPVGRQRFSLLGLLPLLLLFYATLLPPEVRLNFLEQTLYAPRIVILVLLPWIIRRLVSGALRIGLPDYLMFLGVFWMIVSFIAFYDLESGLVRGSAIAFDVIAGYLIARLSIRNSTDFLRFLVLIVPGVLAVGLIMMLESVSHQHIIRPLAAEVFGPLSIYRDGNEIGQMAGFTTELRLGLLRAGGPFSHPILAGLFMASMLPIFFYSGLRGWPLWLGASLGFFAIFSGSSAAILGLIMSLGLLAYDWVQKRVDFLDWRKFLLAGAATLGILQMLSQNGLISVLVRFTLDPQTGQFRLLIWQYGVRSVQNHPLIGIGYTEYERALWMPPTIDNHWLLLAIRHGLATPVLIALACGMIIYRLSRMSLYQNEIGRRFYVGFAIGLFVFALLGFTVAFFGSVQYWFYMLMGVGMSLCLPRSTDPAFAAPATPPPEFAVAR